MIESTRSRRAITSAPGLHTCCSCAVRMPGNGSISNFLRIVRASRSRLSASGDGSGSTPGSRAAKSVVRARASLMILFKSPSMNSALSFSVVHCILNRRTNSENWLASFFISASDCGSWGRPRESLPAPSELSRGCLSAPAETALGALPLGPEHRASAAPKSPARIQSSPPISTAHPAVPSLCASCLRFSGVSAIRITLRPAKSLTSRTLPNCTSTVLLASWPSAMPASIRTLGRGCGVSVFSSGPSSGFRNGSRRQATSSGVRATTMALALWKPACSTSPV